MLFGYLSGGDVVVNNLGVDAGFANAASDQLRVLRTKVDY